MSYHAIKTARRVSGGLEGQIVIKSSFDMRVGRLSMVVNHVVCTFGSRRDVSQSHDNAISAMRLTRGTMFQVASQVGTLVLLSAHLSPATDQLTVGGGRA
jgi:hypothetical protein